jgi:hypothetical protein
MDTHQSLSLGKLDWQKTQPTLISAVPKHQFFEKWKIHAAKPRSSQVPQHSHELARPRMVKAPQIRFFAIYAEHHYFSLR